jgi:3-deoxy-D-manno-octulosonate 8-phosphate phosphatase KdsC-like HAD superfamily phosphatase
VKVALEVGVSSSMVKKRCKKLGIPTPPPGYWSKVRGLL